MSKSVNDMRLFLAKSIAALGSAESSIIDLQEFSLDGFFGCQVSMTGNGTAKIQAGVSVDKVNYIYSSDPSDDIVTAFTKTTGPGGDGKNIYQFEIVTARWLKIKVTETGGANGIVVTVDVAMQ